VTDERQGQHLASKHFPGFNAFYLLNDPFDDRAFRAKLHLSVNDAFGLTRGERTSLNAVTAQRAMGQKLTDALWTTLAAPVLFSRSVVNLLRSGGFTGWTTYPVILHLDDGTTTIDYSGLAVTGRCGPIESSKSQIVGKQYPAGIFPVLRGMYFDPQSWDGSDVFVTAKKAGFIFVTAAVKQSFEIARVRNVVFQPLDQVERMRP
jgi:hypothetical protein